MFASKNFSLTAPSNTSVGSFTIGNSLRFRNSVSAYLNRTPGTSSNRNTFTFSFWIKWTGDTGGGEIFAVTSGSGSSGTQEDNRLDLNLSSTGTFTFYEWTNNSIVCRKTPTQVFRDPGSWYHFVVAIDYTQAVADNRIKMYVNGSQITSFSTNISPSQNQTSYMNGAGNAHYIGGVIKQYNNFSDQYLAEFNVIDGQALTPSSFGTFNQYGVWQPIKYTGTYGTNGFYLPFPTTPNTGSLTASYLVVAGGGGGYIGGGGAGGFRTGTLSVSVSSGTTYTVTVGGGGATNVNGSDSVFSSIISTGGGGGAAGGAANSGGSGGGGSYNSGAGAAGNTPSTSPSQGNSGGNGSIRSGGGGGGAGAAGSNAPGAETGGNGGSGTASSISGSSVTYAGGGGGSCGSGTSSGGSGGGGTGSYSGSGSAPGGVNTGGGSGGAQTVDSPAGGSGIVIISYSGSQKFIGGTVTSVGGNTIHTFTSSGILTTNGIYNTSGIFNDYSGNNNNWTGNNFNVTTTGPTYDSMTDVPTLTSATAANYAVLNPIFTNGFNPLTLTNANLTATSASGARLALGTMYVTTGAYYFEATCTTVAASGSRVGIRNDSTQRFYDNSGNYFDGSSSAAYGATYTTGDVIGVAFDLTNQTITFYKNNTSQGQKTSIGLTGILVAPFVYADTSGVWNLNFGQQPFTYTPPTGFVALNAYNLPTPTIPNGALYMAATTYTGTGSAQNIINTFNRASFQPDFVWAKSRSTAYNNLLVDVLRGITNYLYSNLINADTASSTTVTSLNANGFSVGTDVGINNNTSTFVAWQWKANGAGVTNTSGTITSTVSANIVSGFSIVTYTGTNTAATVGHGLGVTPSMIIVKQRNSSVENWLTYHSSLTNPTTSYLYLNSTAAQATLSVYWNGGPTSSVFGIGAYSGINASAGTYVAYVFAAIAGYSAFGSYVGNGSTDGTFVYTGFRPRFIMAKCSSNSTASTVWTIWDTSRSPYNAAVNELFPNSNAVENVDTDGIDILSNGFKPKRNSEYANFSGWTYIYMAFAENPFKYALAR